MYRLVRIDTRLDPAMGFRKKTRALPRKRSLDKTRQTPPLSAALVFPSFLRSSHGRPRTAGLRAGRVRWARER